MAIVDTIGNVATVITIISFLTGIIFCRDIYRAGTTETFSSFPFSAGVLCTFLWLRYGFILNDSTMIFVNTIGLFLQSVYLAWFFIFTPIKSQINGRISLLLSLLLTVHLYIRYALEPESILGPFASISSLIFCASPLAAVQEVIRSRSTEKLPFPMILSSFLVSSLWFIYGYLISNAFVQLPNGIGALISGVQLSLFVVFPAKRKAE